jgi:predicted glycosyltransferase
MNILFELNHPKHFHQFKFVIEKLKLEGHKVIVIARNKDILLQLLNENGVEFIVFGKHKKNYLSKIFNTFSLIFNYIALMRKLKVDLVISKASFYGTFTAKLLRKKSIIFPDSEIVKVTNKFVVPLASKVITPENFTLNFGKKHHKIEGFFESCYLAPQVFQANSEVLEKSGIKSPFALVRFIAWNANHDLNNHGFSENEKIKLIEFLSQNLNVYISSEGKIPESLLKYKLPSASKDIHHVLNFATLYVGDSQSMATEAALLGTPSFRYNSFVGENDMSNFILLEEKHKMLLNFAEFDDLMMKLSESDFISAKENAISKRENYNLKIGDLNQKIVDLILKN